MYDLDRVVEKYERKLHLALDGSPQEADIPTRVSLFRARMAVQVQDLTAAKGWLNDNGTESALHGFYMSVVNFGRKLMTDKLGGDVLKEAINSFIDALVIKIGASMVKADAQAMVYAILGVPLV